MRALGISPQDYGDDDAIEIWPENIQAVNFFLEYCPSQWQHGFNGPTGLNYPSVKLCIGDEESDPEKAKEIFWCVRRIERGALSAMAEKRRRDEAER